MFLVQAINCAHRTENNDELSTNATLPGFCQILDQNELAPTRAQSNWRCVAIATYYE
jgi:hypothetical protein